MTIYIYIYCINRRTDDKGNYRNTAGNYSSFYNTRAQLTLHHTDMDPATTSPGPKDSVSDSSHCTTHSFTARGLGVLRLRFKV